MHTVRKGDPVTCAASRVSNKVMASILLSELQDSRSFLICWNMVIGPLFQGPEMRDLEEMHQTCVSWGLGGSCPVHGVLWPCGLTPR